MPGGDADNRGDQSLTDLRLKVGGNRLQVVPGTSDMRTHLLEKLGVVCELNVTHQQRNDVGLGDGIAKIAEICGRMSYLPLRIGFVLLLHPISLSVRYAAFSTGHNGRLHV